VAEELILNAVAGSAFRAGRTGIEAVGSEEARCGVIGQVGGLDPVEDLASDFGVENGEDHLDAAMEIAGHKIGAAEVDEWITVVVKDIDAAVFEETVDDAADADVFAEAGDAGPEAADPANDHVDGDALLRGGVEGVGDLLVDEGVDLDEDAGLATRALVSPLAVDHFNQAGSKVERGDEEFIEVGGFRHPGEDVKEGGDLGGKRGAGGEKAEVGIQPGGARVVVAGAEMKIRAEVAFFAANKKEGFAVGFQADEAVDDVNAGFFHLFGPGDVVGFVEAGLELHEDGDLLLVAGGLDESVNNGGVAAGAVEGHLNGEDIGILGGVLQ